MAPGDLNRQPGEGVGRPPQEQLDRRTLLGRAVIVAAAAPAASLLNACGGGDNGMMGGEGRGGEMMDEGMPGWMMGGDQMMDATMMDDMRVIHQLLQEHAQIERDVDDIPGGIRSRTISDNPEIADLITTHVQQMKRRVEDGRPIRVGDPVFREIFEHHRKIEMELRPLGNGALVVETSRDPQVELLIRQHAHRAVSEFVRAGMSRAMRPTPLPEPYGE